MSDDDCAPPKAHKTDFEKVYILPRVLTYNSVNNTAVCNGIFITALS